MLRVFLVEDESVIREGLRDKIPWEQYGFQFVGEAADGEMALPLIRKLKPDVLITDIKMPFMDGLSLSAIVKEEFPRTRVIIISGYDDFEYARQAIVVGVDQYLLKPITRAALRNVLLELKEKIGKNVEQQDYQAQFQDEMQEFEQFPLRRFFEKTLDGKLSVKEIYDEAGRLSLQITAPCYNLLIFSLLEKESQPSRENRERFMRKQDEIFHYFLRRPQFILFRLNVNSYGVLIKGERGQLEGIAESGLDHIRRLCVPEEAHMGWYVAVGEPVERLSMLPQCYLRANHYFAYRYILPGTHILTEHTLASYLSDSEEKGVSNVDFMQMDPELIRDFLAKGEENEITGFVESYLGNIGNGIQSRMFRGYVFFNIRVAVITFLESIRVAKEQYQESIEGVMEGTPDNEEDIYEYFVGMLRIAMRIRDQINNYHGKKQFKKALDYIDSHFDQEGLSLSLVAEQTGMSPNYLSTIFSQNMQKTFIEYVTEKRIEKAKKLLRQTDKAAGEIAKEVGYKDAHYFSFVFRKLQGCNPREYRAQK